ncbi:MAG: 5'/3'-nucleotidase SurE [Acidimicrobiales bacterium]|jgi:5'-nucleotidase
MRILITNDDGVFAPGIAALARGLHAAFGGRHELVVVAPLTDHSGASAAVGPVYERESIPYQHVDIPGLPDVPTYGIDGSPALSVILGCIEGFGPRPDMIVSGINHGINAGRSALHSGTVGAALTGAQFGVRGLAVSIAWASDPDYWTTAVDLACRIIPLLAESEPSTVLNLNVPAVRPDQLKGLRHGRLGRVGLIRSVRPEHTPLPVDGPGIDRTGGAIVLSMRGMGRDPDRLEERAELEPGSDAALVEDGWASITALVGVRENQTEGGVAALDSILATHGG